MKLPLYQVDAFTSDLFSGNPAAVCPLDQWLPDTLMQSIALENNLSETAFFIPAPDGFHIRWFTPVKEVDLCGHATLATAHVLFNLLGHPTDTVVFDSRSGKLSVTRDKENLIMDFPIQPPIPCELPAALADAFDSDPVECLKSEDYLLVFKDETDIISANPDLELLKRLDLRGVIITAPARQYDFISRFFAPKYGVPEDPVTGSAHTQLAPYWASRTGLKRFRAKQVSARGGELACEISGNRVLISGKAVTYLEGSIQVTP